jgi:hypothetical protein
MYSDTLEFVLNITMHCKSQQRHILANKSALDLMIASWRSRFIFTRVHALNALRDLYWDIAEPHPRTWAKNPDFDPFEPDWPPHIQRALGGHNDSAELLLSLSRFTMQMEHFKTHKDMCKFGLRVCALILDAEFSVPVSDVSDQNYPWKTTLDALPFCVRALRERDDPEDEDDADVIELKWAMMAQGVDASHELADKALERNPSHPYFLYVRSAGSESVVGLQLAKRGMQCKNLSPFLKGQFRRLAMEHAYDLGTRKLTEARKSRSQETKEMGVALLSSALADSHICLAEAPMDGHHTKRLITYHILIYVCLKGGELSADMRELKVYSNRITFPFVFISLDLGCI